MGYVCVRAYVYAGARSKEWDDVIKKAKFSSTIVEYQKIMPNCKNFKNSKLNMLR